jgi:hypothetical protein
MATGSSTSNQWKAAAAAAEDAAYKADLAAFAAEQSVLDAKANVYKANLAIESAKAQGNAQALAAANQQLLTAQNLVVTSTANASQVRQQSNNAIAAAESAAAKAAENASSPLSETTPPPASASPGNPTSYQYVPATVTPVTSPSPSAANGFSASSVTTSTYSTSQTTTVENTTGGGSVTTVSTPAVATPKSTALQSQADVAQKQADLLSLNPNTAFGQRALDRKLAEGTITQDQYNYVKGLSNEERIAAKNAELNKAIDLQTQANSATFQPPPTVTTTPNQNTTEVTVTNIKTANVSQSTTINGEVSGYNVTTETIDGVTYQVTNDPNGAGTTYTAADGTTVDLGTPVEKINPELVPSGGGSIPYDELGNLNPGWEQDELGNPYYVGTDMVPKIAPELVPNGPTSDPYDETGQLNPGWGLDEDNNPVWVGEGYIDATGENISDQKTVPNGPTSDPYDELGNLNPGWGLDENNNPVWVGEGYIDATGENISDQKTVPNGPTSDPYDELGNLNPGWGLDENNNPVWIKEGYIDATGENISDQKTIPVGSIQGPPYDDEGNLMPGWSLDEDNNPVWVGNNADGTIFVEPATQASADASRAAAQGLTAKQLNTNSQATQQDVSNFKQKEDWRVRLSLAPSANYLYKVPKGSAGILEPLQATDGVIFPYTPQIQVNYQANYDPTELTHSNYKIFQYRNSGVDSVSITCDFTAQDTYEANYLLAVIHFFKSVTKMFYGQDQNPKPGTPPPLCYLTGLGAFQFDAHPLAITSFNYSLPSDVDYIRAGAVTAGAGVNRSASNVVNKSPNISDIRLDKLRPGGQAPAPIFSTPPGTVDPTYVPTKIQMTIGAVPVVTRNDISNNFSLEKYATGQLLRGTKRQGGGIW